jgi:glycosyltransferase involved in cell wall biosynthesis
MSRTERNQPARIVFLIHSLAIGGAEGQLIELLRNLDRAHFEPSLLLLDNVGAERAASLADPIQVIGRQGKSVRQQVMHIATALRTLQPAILHAFLPEPSILGFAAAKLSHAPRLVASRRSLVDCYRPGKNIFAVKADQVATRAMDHVICNSRAIEKEVVTVDGVPSQKVTTIYNGIDTERFRPVLRSSLRQELGWNDSQFVFGCVANFHHYKRHIDIVRAARTIVQDFPRSRFLLVGEDRGAMSEVVKEIDRSNLQSFFAIVPGMRQPERAYAVMDVYISASDTEGLSNVLLEAQACGIPVIATNVGGNQEAVRDEVDGIIVPPRSPEQIASAAIDFLSNPETVTSMGQLARRHMAQEFSIRAMVSAHEKIYLRLLNSGNQ